MSSPDEKSSPHSDFSKPSPLSPSTSATSPRSNTGSIASFRSEVSPGLEWDNIRLVATSGRGRKKKEKLLLEGVSGYAHRGEMTAILGPSGSGKTSLTNVLTGRIGGGNYKVEGKVLFQGKPRSEATWKSTTGYVEQNDLMYDSLTVKETIIFSAMTRLPSKAFSKKQKIERANEVIDMLGLSKVKDTLVGSEQKRGVSGGERKRVAVGVELVTLPKLLFLDEPTSGLDSHSAFNVVSNIRDISRQGVAVMCTIHQPAWDLFKMFDRVILLSAGRVAFHGTIPDAIEYFTKLGYPLPKGSNAADHFISILTEPPEHYPDEEKQRVRKILDAWQNEGKSCQDVGRLPSSAENPPDDPEDKPGFGLPYLEELYWLLKRGYTQQLRAKTTFIAALMQSIFIGIVLSFAFFQLGSEQKDILSRLGLLFFIPVNNTFSVLFPIISYLPLLNGILVRERRTGSYRVSTFYLSRLLIEIPLNLLARCVFFIMIYWISAFKYEAGAFFIFFALNCLTVIFAVSMGLFIGSTSSSLAVVQAVTPALNVIFILFGGFLLPLNNIPPWFIWAHWISYMTYVFAGLSINEFSGRKFDCQEGTPGCYPDGQAVLEQYDLLTFSIAENVGFLLALTVVCAALGYIMLRRLTRPKLWLKI